MNSTNDQIKHSTATDGKPPVSSSSLSDWRNDEYSEEEFDEDDFEQTHGNSEAENCHCGAYKWSNGRWLHVSDCCC